eukprot:CAMPEP_0204181782 /NCGR_PEP_ID=MMETSP0361-20130328/52216_1 /ASSEMBLY_ACC=CAM_ASM_000343 /TAXON_ID=268821 /ORGANISM="Scrippsiella Hangoei, Strain SHTV-5" /LENGTH=256 /DNA_ID=CAMNT_0051141407 /DNA_START=250 /DNA_END=1022 /DNA_ORIENTATION=+
MSNGLEALYANVTNRVCCPRTLAPKPRQKRFVVGGGAAAPPAAPPTGAGAEASPRSASKSTSARLVAESQARSPALGSTPEAAPLPLARPPGSPEGRLCLKQHVRVAHLPPRVLAGAQLQVANRAGVHDADHGVEVHLVHILDLLQRAEHGVRIADPRGFDDDDVDRVPPCSEDLGKLQGEVLVDLAAHATVHERDDAVLIHSASNEGPVNVDAAVLVDEDCGPEALAVCEDVVHQGGFAGAEETGDQADRHAGAP